jgi:hypothetical protein
VPCRREMWDDDIGCGGVFSVCCAGEWLAALASGSPISGG